MEKSAEAFRTIAEVADTLGVAQHVLRFWEQRFTQVAPMKRAGGRRYYRPADLALLAGLKSLLHDEGLTIRGAQKRLAEDGVASVQALGADWLRDHGDAPPIKSASNKPERRKPAPRKAAAKPAPKAKPAATEPAPEPEPAAEAVPEPTRADSQPVAAPRPAPAPAPAAPAPIRAADTADLPLFADLDPAPAPKVAKPAKPAPTRYADPIAERLAQLTTALRRCDALCDEAHLPSGTADELTALARDLRALAASAAAAPSA